MNTEDLKNTYNKIASDYHRDHEHDTWDDDYIDLFFRHLFPHAKVLDLGCGPGVEAAKLEKKGLAVYGMDLSHALLKIAHENIATGIFLQGDMLKKFPYESNFFDGIFAKASLLHVPKDKMSRVLAEIGRVLKKNGILHVALKKGTGEDVVREDDYGYEYERFFAFWENDEIEELFRKYSLSVLEKENMTNRSGSTIWLKYLLEKK